VWEFTPAGKTPLTNDEKASVISVKLMTSGFLFLFPFKKTGAP